MKLLCFFAGVERRPAVACALALGLAVGAVSCGIADETAGIADINTDADAGADADAGPAADADDADAGPGADADAGPAADADAADAGADADADGGGGAAGGAADPDPDPDPDADAVRPLAGGTTLRVAVEAEGDGLNPAANNFAAPAYVMAFPVVEPLVYWDADSQWTPYLAERITKMDDSSAWQLKLREGVFFHDGTELDADDVIATFSAQYSDPIISQALRPIYSTAEPITKIDEYTVQYNLKSGYARYPALLTGQLGMVVPSEWVALAMKDPSLNQTPVGTGPFMLEERIPDVVTVLTRNPDYWAADAVDIQLDRIEIYPITEPSVFLDRLRSDASRSRGGISGGADDGNGSVDVVVTSAPEVILALREQEDITTVENVFAEEDFIMLNTSAAPFDDMRVRQALAFATPREDFVQLVGRGVAPAADTMFHPDLLWHNPDVKQQTDAPELAAPLVDDYCSDYPGNCFGGKINAEFQYAAGPLLASENIADLLADAWGDYFNITRQMVPQDDHILEVALGQFNIATWRQFGEMDPDEAVVWLSCDSIGLISPNWSRYCDERRDEIMRRQRTSEDPEVRREIWHEVQQRMRDSYAYIFLMHTNWTVGVRKGVENICGQVSPGSGGRLFCNERGRLMLSQIRLSPVLIN